MEKAMTSSLEVVCSFYDKLKAENPPGALSLMSHDIEWIAMWHYKVNGRDPEHGPEDLIKPLMAERSSFALSPAKFIVSGDTAVSLRRFSGGRGTTGKRDEAAYAHVRSVTDSRITRFRQYINTLASVEARRS